MLNLFRCMNKKFFKKDYFTKSLPLRIKLGRADNWDTYNVQVLKCNGDVLTYEFETLQEAKLCAEVLSKDKTVDYCEVL